MRRRDFIGLIGGMAAFLPPPARAQGMRKLGVLMIVAEDDPDSKLRIAAFRQGLQELGWQDGQNIRIEYRWAGGKPDLIHEYAQELVALAPDIILANGTPVVAALKPLTRAIPIVGVLVVDPVGLGFVTSLSRPGGNITGFSFINSELIGKWTSLIRDAAPGVSRAMLLYNPKITPFYADFLREIAAAPQSVAVQVVPATVDIVHRSAGYVDRILKGANPAELPVQQPTKFEFVVNQKAAAALGLALSPTLLSLADEVIE